MKASSLTNIIFNLVNEVYYIQRHVLSVCSVFR